MATEPDLRREIADERRELTNAVDSLKEEVGKTTERAKHVGAAVGAVAGAALALRTALRIRRHFRD
ncbi:MAG TPA: hypothetical protein VGH46_01005 [Gaiellaceae bacterium]|jgi:hypothetical protein